MWNMCNEYRYHMIVITTINDRAVNKFNSELKNNLKLDIKKHTF